MPVPSLPQLLSLMVTYSSHFCECKQTMHQRPVVHFKYSSTSEVFEVWGASPRGVWRKVVGGMEALQPFCSPQP